MKENTPKVSIIVPIYNVENYLRQCLDSIVGQTLRDIEIILVNDGSTDSSPKIMKEYAKRDERIRIIDKPNEGYGRTMNRGIDAATGEYIGIVESDDWIEPDMYEALYALATKHNCDVVKSQYFDYIVNKNIKRDFLPKEMLNKVSNPKHGCNAAIFYCQPCIWSAIYRRDFLNKYNIRFLETPGASYQDTGFNFKVWAMADKVYLTPGAFLHYRQHPNQSIASTGKVFCIADEWAEIDRFMDDYPAWKKSSAKLRNQVKLGNYRWNLNRLEGADKELFRRRFAQEYENAIENNEVERRCFGNMKGWLKFRRILEPDNFGLKLARLVVNIARFFLKSRLRCDKKRWYILGGLVQVWSSDIPSQWLPFTGETSR
ncbi:MAG: glycosyltransferase [Rickettsiales bacterium]|nr:glycosyltransferase [Rickettsiales bacterium]